LEKKLLDRPRINTLSRLDSGLDLRDRLCFFDNSHWYYLLLLFYKT
jgi:hypothetical protein